LNTKFVLPKQKPKELRMTFGRANRSGHGGRIDSFFRDENEYKLLDGGEKMGERYLVTGTQLGMLKAFLETNHADAGMVLIDGIINEQHAGTSETDVANDVNKIWESKIIES
jgi:hypothetical protein